jgi:hypothetical protein
MQRIGISWVCAWTKSEPKYVAKYQGWSIQVVDCSPREPESDTLRTEY